MSNENTEVPRKYLIPFKAIAFIGAVMTGAFTVDSVLKEQYIASIAIFIAFLFTFQTYRQARTVLENQEDFSMFKIRT